MEFDNIIRKAWKPVYLLPLALPFVLAYLDNIGRRMFLTVPNNGEVYQAMEPLYLQLFDTFMLTVILGMAAVVYYYRQDIGDALAFLVFSLFTVHSGLWDVLYYVYQGIPVPEVLEHLSDAWPGTVACLLNNCVVTNEMLYLNTAAFLLTGLALAALIRRLSNHLGL